MMDIRNGKTRQSLRKTSGPKLTKISGGVQKEAKSSTVRKVIAVDEDDIKSLLDFETDDEDSDNDRNVSNGDDSDKVFNHPQHVETHPQRKTGVLAPAQFDVSLDEFCLIRRKETKAELDDAYIDKATRKDLAKERLCFVCRKTRFGLLSWSWGTRFINH